MRTWQSFRISDPCVSVLTGLCVALALVAFALAATSSGATAETAPARFAVGPNETLITGTVVGVGEALVGIQEAGGAAPVAFAVTSGAPLSRDGVAAALGDLRQHDQVHLTVDRAAGTVVQIVAEPAPRPIFQPSASTAAVAALGLFAAAVVLAGRLRAAAPATARELSPEPSPPVRPSRLPKLALAPFTGARRPGCHA